MDKLNREPLTLAGAVILALHAIIAWLISMGWVAWNSEQVASFNNLVIVLVELAVLIVPLYLARRKVTPVADPRMANGAPARLIAKQ